MPTVSKIVLCPETQLEEDDLIDNPPRKASIHLDFSLFIHSSHKRFFPHTKVKDAGNGWSIITPARELAAMIEDLQSMTWKHFQGLAIKHLAPLDDTPLSRLLSATRNAGALHWQAFISGHVKFSEENKTEIGGHLDFIDFAALAYELFPNKVIIKLVMKEPPKVMPPNAAQTTRITNPGAAGEAEGSVRETPGSKPAQSMTVSSGGGHMKRVHEDEPEAKAIGKGHPSSSSAPGRPVKQAKNQAPADNENEIEVIQGPTRAGHDRHADRQPLGPEAPVMEAVDMDTYLTVAHIEETNQATRRRLRSNGITHWTFFRRSTENELVRLGFPLGVARLLCEGVPRLERYVQERSTPL
ncbi:uncharacterized protein PGTG_15071 [Puccinia graminis f. sp. tritici CRL 75-36-700-3]|uniref:Uncharacterized protein n=1 Tax=Puccinia graminis f. sp. tritici (strain CRL 75-36-700-3 / race SCCL) TaxID=418459 RepID=E3KY29_PUCGT|nr:uncharacterized protein PGTG_15071 [Puccinia graminis f. sp. tritici CRL 75-36-700-3]EFP89230.1 hypothetical protein PGTG_15071 [Puccinia graminis f. sp. tritici CRL 75-36-700-3]